MSIRPTDLPMSPVREGETVRRVDAKPEARDRSRQPARDREEAEADTQDERGAAGDADDAVDAGDEGDAPAVIELSGGFRRGPLSEPDDDTFEEEPPAEGDADDDAQERHLDIQA